MYTESWTPETELLYDPKNARWDEYSMEILRTRTGVFTQMLQEAIDADISLPFRSGSAASRFQELEDETRGQLDEVSPDLKRDVLYGQSYQSQESKDIHEEKTISRQIDEVAKSHRSRSYDLAGELVETGNSLSVSFADSPYVSMDGVFRSCELATFLTLFQATTGNDLTTREASEVIAQDYQCLITGLPNHTFPKMLSTSAFREAYPDTSCQPIIFAGCTLDDLSKVVEKVSNRFPEAEIRVALSVLNKDSGVYSVMHNVVPLSIAPELTVAHDPAEYGGARHEFDTDNLLRRWYMAHGAGYLVVTQRSE
jgi:hypothetical protein